MGAPIGVAKDMAKLNEENLSRLSRQGMFEKLKSRGSKSNGKPYHFKKASSEVILEIRNKTQIAQAQVLRKHILLFMLSIPITIGLLYLLIRLLRYALFS